MGNRRNLRPVPEEFREAKKPDIHSVRDLMLRDLPPVRWVVPRILPEGVTLLAGKAKVRKSWLAMGLCVAVATGGFAFGHIPVERGEVLYAALEDNERRIQSRLGKVLEGAHVAETPSGMFYATEFPRLDEGGADALVGWLEEHPACRLVVVDTLAKIRPRSRGNSSGGYQEDYEALEGLLPIASKYQVAILVVTHTRKAGATDVLDEINATMGLMGGVDGFLIMRSGRGTAEGGASATMHVDGREIEEPGELALRWDPEITGWRLVGNAEDTRLTEERRLILDILAYHKEPMQFGEIVKQVGKSKQAVTKLLGSLAVDGRVERVKHGLWRATSYEQTIVDELAGVEPGAEPGTEPEVNPEADESKPGAGGGLLSGLQNEADKAHTYGESEKSKPSNPSKPVSGEVNRSANSGLHGLRGLLPGAEARNPDTYGEFTGEKSKPQSKPGGGSGLQRADLSPLDHGRGCTCEMCQGDA